MVLTIGSARKNASMERMIHLGRVDCSDPEQLFYARYPSFEG